MGVAYFDPRAAQGRPDEAYTLRADLNADLMIGMLANGFPDSERFLRYLGEALARKFPRVRFRHVVKPIDSAPVAADMLSAIARECGALISAYGHCGSCTSGTVRDAIAAARRGLPAVALVTAAFWDQGNFVAEADGMAGVPRIKLPYPVAGTGDESLRALAAQVAEQAMAALAGR